MIQIPPHAYATSGSGEQNWHCERGYASHGNSCMAVRIPVHAYLTDSGDGWQCERGFHAVKDSCTSVALPINAHLDSTGNAWACNWGYEMQGSRCVSESLSSASAGVAGESTATPLELH